MRQLTTKLRRQAKIGASLSYVRPTSFPSFWLVASGLRDADVAIRGIEGRMRLRADASDANVADSTFRHRYHLPEWDLPHEPLIWDLGANIGLTTAHLAAQYPSARVLAVELDADNVTVARHNTAHLGDRCEVIHAGIWPTDEPVTYAKTTTQGFAIGGDGGAEISAPGISPATLLRLGDGQRVAFAKIDVEGAERRILYDDVEWTENVDSMKIEMHGREMAAVTRDMIRQLTRLGFDARVSAMYGAAVIARRTR